jgi:nitroreductase
MGLRAVILHNETYYVLGDSSMNVGTMTIAGFRPEEVKKILKLPDSCYPLYVMTIG